MFLLKYILCKIWNSVSGDNDSSSCCMQIRPTVLRLVSTVVVVVAFCCPDSWVIQRS